MIIIGAKGFAKEVLEVLHQLKQIESIAFYDDVNEIGETLYDCFPILKNEEQVKAFFERYGTQFTIGIGNPKYRYLMCKKFEEWGGNLVSTISPFSHIGHFGNLIETGSNVMTGTVITNDVSIGKGCLINLNCTIGHDTVVEGFVELCPGVHISGNCKIGALSFIGTNATVLPNITIGKNVIIGAGALVTKDLPDNVLAMGSPAKVIRELPETDFL
ncbi:acetyltransferase [Flavobacterium sp.]|uniref:acetyltransferase n=1 Tax=Flavobacterium sp. TaxID=239 RepID=UPI0025FB8045|nr:acetyltransferase [Flavobacterium sp.]